MMDRHAEPSHSENGLIVKGMKVEGRNPNGEQQGVAVILGVVAGNDKLALAEASLEHAP